LKKFTGVDHQEGKPIMAIVMQDPREEMLARCTRHVSKTGTVTYTVLSESDPEGIAYYTVRFPYGPHFPQDNCPAGLKGQRCKHKSAAMQLEAEYQAAQHEKSAVKRSGLKAYERRSFDVLAGLPGKESTMTKINLKAGDIPETDAEVDAAIEKMNRNEARKAEAARGKPSAKNDRQANLAIVRKNAAGEIVEPKPEPKAKAAKPAPKPAKAVAPKPAKEIKRSLKIQGVASVIVTGYTTQELLDKADHLASAYGQAPYVMLSGTVLVDDEPRDISGFAPAVNIGGDTWKLIYDEVAVKPLGTTWEAAKFIVSTPEVVEKRHGKLLSKKAGN
jgi:hypothetical protein